MRRLLVLAVLLVALPAGAVNVEYVAVRDANNAPDTATNCLNAAPDCGSVTYDYAIARYEVTNEQYAEFLNAVAATDTNGLYSTEMSSDARGGITQSGVSGSYTYAVKSGQGNNPVVFVSWYDAARFTNWLHNGQPTGAQGAGTTEGGAYTLTGATSISGGRQVGALAFLPTEDEWYKAAYYDPALPGYYDYPAGTDTLPTCAAPGATPNTANCGLVVGAVTDVGSYTGSASPYGTFDQGGNVWEWNEQVASGSGRGLRGGSWNIGDNPLAASNPDFLDPTRESIDIGFRVASPVPEPAQVLLVLTGGLLLAAARRQRRA